VLLAGCSKPAQQAAAPASGGGKIGYVDTDALVHAHPLYPQLAQIELSMDALNLHSLGPGVGSTGSGLAKQDAELQQELTDASNRTNQLLQQKQTDYQRQENAAISAALAAGGHAAAAGSVGANVGATAGKQVGNVNAEMNRDVNAYRRTLSQQEQQQERSYEKAVSDRVNRQLQAKANELQNKESELELSLQTKDASERLELRTRLNNLALDQGSRDQVKAQLDALDKGESDQVAAMRNRDQQTLAQLRTQLRGQALRDVGSGIAKIRAQNGVKLGAQGGGNTGAVPGSTVASTNLPADLKAKIAALHKEYQERYMRDANATVAQFNKTRDDLQKRYNELHAADSGASSSLRKELASLQAQHDQLYSEIVDQINREVRIVAQEQGVSTVISGVLGNGSGVDLTQAAKKEIESLHE
jgi:Skp family chaperone for outer membrane proteins